MARTGITRKKIRAAVAALERQGRTPSLTNVRLELGTGSYSTIGPLLREILHALEIERQAPRMPESMMSFGSELVMDMWLRAWKEAQERIERLQQEHGELVCLLRSQIQTMQDELDRLSFEASCLKAELSEKQSEVTSMAQVATA